MGACMGEQLNVTGVAALAFVQAGSGHNPRSLDTRVQNDRLRTDRIGQLNQHICLTLRALNERGLHSAVGQSPTCLAWAVGRPQGLSKDLVELDRWGFVKTRHMQTSMPGVFAAGDVRAESTKQAASAAGEGASAALALREYLQEIGG